MDVHSPGVLQQFARQRLRDLLQHKLPPVSRRFRDFLGSEVDFLSDLIW